MKPPTLIGPAGKLASILNADSFEDSSAKLLFVGPPGVGKTSLADAVALNLTGSAWGIESVNGRNATIHLVREWIGDMASSSLYGTGWKVKIVNEVDTMPKDAQDALLSFLDEMPSERGFIATSNLDLTALTERFRTRLQRYEVKAPEPAEIAALLEGTVPAEIAKGFAGMCAGNVRAACLDAEAWHRQNGTVRISRLARRGDAGRELLAELFA